MTKRLLLFLILTGTIFSGVQAQFTDRYWAFGDSAGIDFKNLSNPQPANSILRCRGTCASICDSAGDLLFYCGSPNWIEWLNPSGPPKLGTIVNKNHSTMQNGDTLVGLGWYQEMAIVPDPGNSQRFYVFTAGEAQPVVGFYYSIVDLSYNNGLGKVVQKNVQLSNDTIADAIAVVRHGNGRDWWVLVRSWKNVPTNDITAYLVSPSGVSANPTQYIGQSVPYAGFFRLKFNIQGNHLYGVCQLGVVERYDFDRCTGLLSNLVIYASPNGPINGYWDFEISPDETKLYANLNMQGPAQNKTHLKQFELDTATFISSVHNLGTYIEPDRGGALKRGPDGKIYFSIMSAVGDTCFDYLLCYGTTNTTCANLSVINFPDSAYPACDYQDFSFSLGGHKTYAGLPNNPNYELDTLHGSPCDTLTSVGIGELYIIRHNMKIYYDKNWQTVFINAEQLKGKNGVLQFYNSSGQLLSESKVSIDGGYFMNSTSFASQSNGVYIVRLQTEKEVLTGRFVKW